MVLKKKVSICSKKCIFCVHIRYRLNIGIIPKISIPEAKGNLKYGYFGYE